MGRVLNLLVFTAVAFAAGAAADPTPGRGRLLVATELIEGDIFTKTVVLLLDYGDTGAAGFVVNRPTELTAAEVFDEDSALSDYKGTIYWGGPVEMVSIRALMNTDTPPEGAEKIIDSVYLVPLHDDLSDAPGLRVFIGYAGWSPGQLDRELAHGSWHLMPASSEHVFAKDPSQLWEQLAPRIEYRAAIVGTSFGSPGR